MDRIIGTKIVLGCQRSDCEETVVIDVTIGPRMSMFDAMALAEDVNLAWPEGWTWDHVEFNTVLHCPEHSAA